MAFTKIVSPGIDTTGSYTVQELNTVGVVTAATVQVGSATTVHTTGIDLGSGNITSHNINSTGIITATSFVGPVTGTDITATSGTFSGNVSIGGILTYEDVTNIDSVGIITARSGIRVTGGSVGIGQTNPQGDLHIGNISGSKNIIMHSANQGNARIKFREGGSTTSGFNEYSIGMDGADNALTVEGQGSGEIIRIMGDTGKIGIGTDNPERILHASGSGAQYIKVTSTSSANAGIEFGDPADTGIGNIVYANSDDSMFFTVNGTERLRILSDGAVIVGDGTNWTKYVSDANFQITDNTNAKLVISNPGNATFSLAVGTNNDLTFRDESQAADRMKIDYSTGYIGIGTDAYGNVDPLAPLHVSSYSPTTAITDHGTLRSASTLLLQTSNNVNNSRSGVMFSGALHSTDGCSAGIIANHENVSEDSESTSLSFYTSHNESLGERLRITSGGLVGIQATPTQQRLTIDVFNTGTTQASYDGINICNTSSTTNNGSAIIFGQQVAGNSNARIGVINSDRSSGSEDQDIFFGTLGGGSYAERLRITSGGQVNIGNSLTQTSRLFTVETTQGSGGEVAYIGNSNAGNYGGLVISAGEIDRECRLESAWGDSFFTFYTQSAGAGAGERLRIHADGEVECKGGAAGQNALLVTGNYSSGSNVDMQTWQRSGGAVQAKIGYKDADTSIFFGTDTAHAITFMSSGSERFRIDPGGTITQNNDIRYAQLGYFDTARSGQNASTNPALAGILSYSYGYQEAYSTSNGSWVNPYPDLVLGYHTGVSLGGYTAYGGCRFFNDHPSRNVSLLFSVGNGNQNVAVVNSLSKQGGTFRIAHPHPSKKWTHDLQHSFIEGPQCDNLYRGRVDLVDGTATINIDTVSNMTDGTFVLLNRDIQCFTSNETGWDPVKGSISGNILTITSQNNSSTDTISWMVIGERQDDKIKSPEMEMTDSDGKLITEPLTIEESHM